ncbi:MAG: CBS domain-containing protein, partial [Dehalococcoidia bacterium]|nr:CBS domain-containing protein [Dehalococcoidia bacterium]
VVTIAADAPAADVMTLLAQRRLNQLPVIDEGRMIGIITRREFLDRLQIAEELGQGDTPDGEAELPPIRTSGSDDPDAR